VVSAWAMMVRAVSLHSSHSPMSGFSCAPRRELGQGAYSTPVEPGDGRCLSGAARRLANVARANPHVRTEALPPWALPRPSSRLPLASASARAQPLRRNPRNANANFSGGRCPFGAALAHRLSGAALKAQPLRRCLQGAATVPNLRPGILPLRRFPAHATLSPRSLLEAR